MDAEKRAPATALRDFAGAGEAWRWTVSGAAGPVNFSQRIAPSDRIN